MQMHPNGSFNDLLDSFRLLDRIILHLNRVQFSMHLNDRTFIIIIGKSFGVEGGTGDNQF